MSSRLRILCLHGFTSNGSVHAHQIRHITKEVPECEFLFPSGPHEVDVSAQMDMTSPTNQAWSEMVNSLSDIGHRAWWFAREGNWTNKETGGFYGLEKSLEFLGNFVQETGPIHAICGFSQGACLAGMLCALLQDKLADHPLRKHLPAQWKAPQAGVIFSGFRARFPQYDVLYEPMIDVPILHVLGDNDPMVKSERSEALIRVCRSSKLLRHSGGHNIPKSDLDREQIVDFLKTHVVANAIHSEEASI